MKWLALTAALALLLFRFAHLGLAPFILDEPVFLHAAAAQLSSGHWLDHSPILGSRGIAYGGTVFWFYGAVQSVFGSAPRAAIAAMCVVVTLSHLALAWALSDYFRGRAWLLAAMIGWIAASPFQFLWSRLAWDQTVDIAAAWVVVLLTRRSPFTIARGMALGVVLGLALSSHLMVAPLAVLAFVFVARQNLRALFACLGVILLVSLPYLHYLLSAGWHPVPLPAIDWRWLGEQLIQPLRVSSLFKISYFFDADWNVFIGGHTILVGALIAFSMIVLGALTVIGFTITLRDSRTRALAAMALALWVVTAAFHLASHLSLQPHYMFACYWVIGFALAAALPRVGRVGQSLFALVLALQAGFILSWMASIAAHHGTTGPHYGATLDAQTQLVRESCGGWRSDVVIANTIAPFDQSLRYIAETDPACAGRLIRVCKPGSECR